MLARSEHWRDPSSMRVQGCAPGKRKCLLGSAPAASGQCGTGGMILAGEVREGSEAEAECDIVTSVAVAVCNRSLIMQYFFGVGR